MSSLTGTFKKLAACALSGALLIGLTAQASRAGEVEKQTAWALESHGCSEKLPVYIWKDSEAKPRGVIIAIHGLVMHGGTFNQLAKSLAHQGYIVYAPDLRGYGRWMLEDQSQEVQYDKSFEDLCDLVTELKAEHENVPLFCMGESLGAGLCMRLASSKVSGRIDGIALSSPALKRKFVYVHPQLVADSMKLVTNPKRQIDIVPYMKTLASDDPRITEEAANDPLVRKKLTARDLWRTNQYIKGNMRYASLIPPAMPVLVIQGDNDRMLRWNAVSMLLSKLKSTDQTVKWFKGRGHLLIETSYVLPETVETIGEWLEDHNQTGPLAAAHE